MPITPSAHLRDDTVAALSTRVLGPHDKGLPPAAWGLTVQEYLATRPRRSHLPTPLLTLSEAALEHNIATMASWCHERGVDLAPHGKTTMAPELWQRQLAAGAWAITVANGAQLFVARSFGVSRVQVANAVLSPLTLRWLAAELAADPDFTVLTWADSVRIVELMSAALAMEQVPRPLPVLVEVGGTGGRTGARTLEEALDIAAAIAASPVLSLAGVSGYEGALAHGTAPEDLERVRDYLGTLATAHHRIRAAGHYPEDAVPVLTAGGSSYFDLVTEVLAPLHDPQGRTGEPARVVLRSGAYIAHDDGFYRTMTPFRRTGDATLRSAMHGWARVSSLPEPGLALFDAGKRDVPFDEGLPEVHYIHRDGGLLPAPEGLSVTAVNDQHGFLRWSDRSAPPVRIGDELRLGLSHPCTAFDKWGLIPVVDDADSADPLVVGLVRTFF
ncbi:alanine racemase [Marinactinospora thermotolerans]|uniref:D-serine deaminase, pyridoxal phosphate-dependent n=1 Tax=Marinactinospora thermotolerans DSM 45154 TaxID=1122192 RepID=A0A1T4SDL4_9ACTN|nr:alanine racemase [Marinactinospora thermotolerans]SKA25968.1 D-serine deaminase, pyridoxal phosphate-dependent [Marinactinospora thermotolerans DSM 45154]